MISYERPATSGIKHDANQEVENQRVKLDDQKRELIATIITTIRKLVPQRGCWRGCGLAFSTVNGNPGFPRENGLVFSAVILKDAANVFQQREAKDHDQKERHSNHAIDAD